MPSFHKSFRLDVTTKSAGLLVYVKGSITAGGLRAYRLPFEIQDLLFDINLRNQKWLFIGKYKPPSQNGEYFI